MTTKQDIVRTMSDLPEDATIEDAIERLLILQKIERGLAQAKRGETIPHEEVVKQMKQWLR